MAAGDIVQKGTTVEVGFGSYTYSNVQMETFEIEPTAEVVDAITVAAPIEATFNCTDPARTCLISVPTVDPPPILIPPVNSPSNRRFPPGMFPPYAETRKHSASAFRLR